MRKQDLIKNITEHDAVIVWEIDKSKYYGTIGFNGSNCQSYWLKYELEKMTNVFLKELLDDILEKLDN